MGDRYHEDPRRQDKRTKRLLVKLLTHCFERPPKFLSAFREGRQQFPPGRLGKQGHGDPVQEAVGLPAWAQERNNSHNSRRIELCCDCPNPMSIATAGMRACGHAGRRAAKRFAVRLSRQSTSRLHRRLERTSSTTNR